LTIHRPVTVVSWNAGQNSKDVTTALLNRLSLLSRHLVLPILCFLGIGAFHCQLATAQESRSQRGCKVGVQVPAYGFWTWAANSEVKVYILTADFKPAEIPYLLAPLQTWNAVAAVTTSGVKFTYGGAVASPRQCLNCLTIMRGEVFDKTKRHATELHAYSAHSDQLMTFASIVIDPILTNPDALSNAVAHELGHNFGLLDCYSCREHTTVMNKFKVVNEPNGVFGPSDCDIAQIRRVYAELKTTIRPSPGGLKLPVDDGEEPVDDETPVIIPKP